MDEPTVPPDSVRRLPCATCSTWPVAGDRFCTTCGADLAAARTIPARPRRRRGLMVAGLMATVVLPIGVGLALLTQAPAEPAEAAGSSGSPTSGSAAATPDPSSGDDLGTAFGSIESVESALCGGVGALECVDITVPADHEDPDGDDFVEVRFGLHEADPDERSGTLVIATGGPGSSGIELAPGYLEILPDSVLDRYDIVFFEQRGVRHSTPMECAEADLDTPDWAEQASNDFAAAAAEATAWVETCLTEAGVDDPSELERFGTGQAAADLDAYLDHIGAERVVLYGESYGTHLAQAYAAQRPERVEGLILDAVVDPTLDAFDATVEQAAAFSSVLDRLFDACDDDELCADDFVDTTAATTWDNLAERLESGPIEVPLPSRNGEIMTVSLSLDDLLLTSGSLLYDEPSRALLLRTMASVARDDLRPLIRLAGLTAGLDPETGRPLSPLTRSSAAYYAISCQHYPADREAAMERLHRGHRDLVDDGARLAAVALESLPCVSGFGGDVDGVPLEAPASAEYPVLVLTSTADPATPTTWAEAVAERMPNAYLIVTTDGGHGTFGWGLPCPDDLVKEFLVFGDLPAERRTECDGYLVDPYHPVPLGGPDAYPDVLDALIGVEEAVFSLPDYVYWDGTARRLGCPHGGWLQMSWEGNDTFELHDCQILPDWPMTGIIEFGSDFTTTMTLEVPNGDLTYESTEDWEVTVEGTLDGASVELRLDR